MTSAAENPILSGHILSSFFVHFYFELELKSDGNV